MGLEVGKIYKRVYYQGTVIINTTIVGIININNNGKPRWMDMEDKNLGNLYRYHIQ